MRMHGLIRIWIVECLILRFDWLNGVDFALLVLVIHYGVFFPISGVLYMVVYASTGRIAVHLTWVLTVLLGMGDGILVLVITIGIFYLVSAIPYVEAGGTTACHVVGHTCLCIVYLRARTGILVLVYCDHFRSDLYGLRIALCGGRCEDKTLCGTYYFSIGAAPELVIDFGVLVPVSSMLCVAVGMTMGYIVAHFA